jgi:sensor histidine kinase YesM
MQIKSQATIRLINLLAAFIISMMFILPPLTAYLEKGGMDFSRPYPRVGQIMVDFLSVFLLAALLLFFITRDIAFTLPKQATKPFVIISVIGSIAICLFFTSWFYLYEQEELLRKPSVVFLSFKFVSASILSVLTACIVRLLYRQQSMEVENERLRTENIQNRFDALSSQINPHFFFNSLNSLASLVRDKKVKESLHYINELSDIFRYVLKNNRQELVTLREEIEFINAYRYLLEIRYENKLFFNICIPEEYMDRMLPAISLHPVVENVVKHNVISNDNPLAISIYITEKEELAISNPIQEKIDSENSFGIGLENLSSRYQLLGGTKIGISSDNKLFIVKLPLMRAE